MWEGAIAELDFFSWVYKDHFVLQGKKRLQDEGEILLATRKLRLCFHVTGNKSLSCLVGGTSPFILSETRAEEWYNNDAFVLAEGDEADRYASTTYDGGDLSWSTIRGGPQKSITTSSPPPSLLCFLPFPSPYTICRGSAEKSLLYPMTFTTSLRPHTVVNTQARKHRRVNMKQRKQPQHPFLSFPIPTWKWKFESRRKNINKRKSTSTNRPWPSSFLACWWTWVSQQPLAPRHHPSC